MSRQDNGAAVAITFPPDTLEAIAQRAADLVADHRGADRDEWLDVEGAARHLGYTDVARGKRRVYDLCAQRRIRFAKDGSRLVMRASWLDAYLEGEAA